MFGPQKVREYLGVRLHELRLHNLDHICHELAQALGGVSVNRVTLNETRLEPLSEPTDSSSHHLQKEYPENIPEEIGYSDQNIPATASDDQRVLQLWLEGQPAKKIGQLTGKTEKTILNRLSLLRKAYDKQAVPRRR
jgi:hypothetical protein